MTEKFLKAKHWQLFILLFGIPLVFQIIFMMAIFASLASDGGGNVSWYAFGYGIFFFFLFLFIMVIYFWWFWSAAMGLQTYLPPGVHLKTSRFKIFFFTPLVYMFVLLAISSLYGFGIQPNPLLLFLLVPIHIFSVFCMFYIIYFIAKTVKTVELQRKTEFSDYIGEFFLLWFFFIGVWIIQPKINKIVEKKSQQT